MTIEEFARMINDKGGDAKAVETEQEKCVIVFNSGDLYVEDINSNARLYGIEVKYKHYPFFPIKRRI